MTKQTPTLVTIASQLLSKQAEEPGLDAMYVRRLREIAAELLEQQKLFPKKRLSSETKEAIALLERGCSPGNLSMVMCARECEEEMEREDMESRL